MGTTPRRAASRGRTARLACALALGSAVACSRAPERPNILLISVDTLRADHLGCYGYERDTSPAIDALAREGTLFENAWSVTSWTLPSHVTMLTGLPVSAHGQCDWDLDATQSVPSHLPRGRFVPEALAREGYASAGFYSCLYLEPKFGFGTGFDVWERAYHSVHTEPGVAELWQAAREAGDHEAMRRIHAERRELFDDEARTTPVAVDAAVRWLRAREPGADPFLLFLHVYDAHSPYTPPEPYASRFDPGYAGSIDGRKLGDVDSPVHAGMDPRDLEHVVALYDGEIAALDADLARLFAELERLELAEDTLVILTSDHGEEFFEHGGKQHGTNLYRESLQVPLIVRWPGRVPPGARRAATVGLIDVAPTLLAAAGLEPDPELPGSDLVALAQGTAAPPPPRTLTAQLTIRRGVEEPVWMGSLIDAREHTILRRAGVESWSAEIFDLESDPRERGPAEIVDESQPSAARVRARMEQARAELRHLRALAPERPGLGTVHAAERTHLQALGYGGDALGEVFGAERLCFDGCIWRR